MEGLRSTVGITEMAITAPRAIWTSGRGSRTRRASGALTATASIRKRMVEIQANVRL